MRLRLEEHVLHGRQMVKDGEEGADGAGRAPSPIRARSDGELRAQAEDLRHVRTSLALDMRGVTEQVAAMTAKLREERMRARALRGGKRAGKARKGEGTGPLSG